ncbi:hypothetical protein E2C01_052425 [Portunus trituberculatus]|uniref:Uncharacterized protein n=1 Tax=Portunus trituberculatus TaxID=210409 RepID=A0A5B7GDN3_PORTR|nr:hypothetical protein [Portunus trituberculatus]
MPTSVSWLVGGCWAWERGHGSWHHLDVGLAAPAGPARPDLYVCSTTCLNEWYLGSQSLEIREGRTLERGERGKAGPMSPPSCTYVSAATMK